VVSIDREGNDDHPTRDAGAMASRGLPPLVPSLAGTLTGALATPFGTIPFTRSDSFSDSVWGFGDLVPQASLRWNNGAHNWMTYITGDIPVGWLVPTTDLLLDRGMMGDGVINLRAIRAMVERAGYRGHCEVEILSANNWWKRDPDEIRRWCDVLLRRGAPVNGRVPGAAQHAVVRCRPGTVPFCGGPGSAVHRSASASRCTAPGHA
jgi:hypothetical protein